MAVPFILCEKAYKMGIEEWISMDYSISSHTLWAGRTGSGKSVASKILLAQTILHAPPELQPVELTVIDPKEDTEFQFLEGNPRFFSREATPEGFNDFYSQYLQRKNKQDLTKNLKILFVDEFASLITLITDKKEREATQNKLALLLMLSRSRFFSIQMATQQPSARIFGENASASREQFGKVCLLGDSGTETQTMLFDSKSREKMSQYGEIGGRGVGWLSTNGGTAQPVKVPFVASMGKLNKVIYDCMARQSAT